MTPRLRKLVGRKKALTDDATRDVVQRVQEDLSDPSAEVGRPPTRDEVRDAGGVILHTEDGEVAGIVLYPPPHME